MDSNTFDVLLVVFISLLVLLGVWRGLMRLLIGAVALVTALVLATRFDEPVAALALRVVEMPEPVADLVAHLSIFLAVVLAGTVVASMLRRSLRAAALRWTDRLAGGTVGLASALLSSALVVMPVVAYAPSGSAILGDSTLAPYLAVVADIANELVPDRLSTHYRDRMESLRLYLQQRAERQRRRQVVDRGRPLRGAVSQGRRDVTALRPSVG